jgi:hypothetical protein
MARDSVAARSFHRSASCCCSYFRWPNFIFRRRVPKNIPRLLLLVQSLGRKYTHRKPPFFGRGWSTSSRFYFILISSPLFLFFPRLCFRCCASRRERKEKKETAWSNAQMIAIGGQPKVAKQYSRGHSRMAIVDRHFDWWGKHFITVSGQSHSAGLYVCSWATTYWCCAYYYRLTTGCWWNASCCSHISR